MKLSNNDQLVLNASNTIYINKLSVDGGYRKVNSKRQNAKILFDASKVFVKNTNISGNSYNIFEQNGSSSKYPISEFKASNVIVSGTQLQHNIFNIYKVASNATIVVEDSTFDLCVSNSNVMRIANVGNANNVTVTFKNVDWTYENADKPETDYEWAGLICFQPWPSTDDSAYHSTNLDAVKTWKFVFDNCKYNGNKITANTFKSLQQVIYGYSFTSPDQVDDISSILDVTFK